VGPGRRLRPRGLSCAGPQPGADGGSALTRQARGPADGGSSTEAVKQGRAAEHAMDATPHQTADAAKLATAVQLPHQWFVACASRRLGKRPLRTRLQDRSEERRVGKGSRTSLTLE